MVEEPMLNGEQFQIPAHLALGHLTRMVALGNSGQTRDGGVFEDLGWQAVAREAKRVVGNGPAYLTFDVDGLDPVYAPGTGTPEAGGITMREAQRLIRELTGLDFIGGDVVEVSPPLDPSGNTALHAATILFEMLCILAIRVSESRSG